MESSSNSLIDRIPVASGRFYSAHADKLEIEIANLIKESEKLTDFKLNKNQELLALIAPHAGYAFSGIVAASAFIQLRDYSPRKKVFLIGSSHHTDFNGVSVYNMGHYQTPLGKVNVDLALANSLVENSSIINFVAAAHAHEHCLEVLLPFIQYFWQNKFEIIPIVIATHSKDICRQLADELQVFFTEDNLFLISTDLSHYPEYSDAIKVDDLTVQAAITGKPEILLDQIRNNKKAGIPNLSTSMCGWTSVLTLMYLTETISESKFSPILYQNSGDSRLYGDSDKVVGYQSIVLTKEKRVETFSLTKNEQQQLLNIARTSIENHTSTTSINTPDLSSLSAKLKMPGGAFVSIYLNKELRGCIGRMHTISTPLFQIVSEVAVSAAYNDTRFSSLSKSDFNTIEIEISVLTPLKAINNIKDIVLGKHGIYIKKDHKSGTFLPQVAKETKWTVEEFLGNCSKNKADIGWDGWKDAKLFTYEAIIFRST